MKELQAFPTIRQEARSGETTTECHLRRMLAQGELPGFYVGRTFRINHEQLVEKLNNMSAAQVGKESEAR